MDRADAILGAVQRIYDAAVSPDAWPGAIAAIAAAANAPRGSLLVENRPQQRAELMVGWQWDPAHLARMSAPGARRMAPWAAGLPLGQVVRSLALKTEHDFVRSEFYNEVVRPNGDFYGAVALVERTPAHSSYVAVRRVLGAEDFADGDVAALQAMVPHLARALDLRKRLDSADLRAAYAGAALDHVDLGVILVDAAARPIRLNQRAEAIIAQADGLFSGPTGLMAALPDQTRRLHHAIATAAAAGDATAGIDAAARAAGAGIRLRLSRPSGAQPLILTVIPIREVAAERRLGPVPRVTVFVVDPDRTDGPAPAVLRQLFDLTAAEAAVAVEISRGDGLPAVAERLAIAGSTARTHLARIFEKTGTARQAELVRLLLQCGLPSMRDD
ncbi:helix-turn-helix transcriptional regulator [Inquilinus sp. 2KB_23]|uniref:helix-turn-helix transcriptional regulator n=1 Tax=Inquilinus sp. 2KB_23 TaxID=3232979 RepID=UPI003F8EAB26